MDRKQFLRSYGRRRGRNFSADKLLGLKEFFATPEMIEKLNKYTILEVGFGFGEHIVKRAVEAPDKIFIGAEVYENGVSKLFEQIRRNGLTNIFIWNDDIRILLEKLQKRVFHKVYILFPDPWPKTKHNKRRIISIPFLKLLASKMHHAGELVVATDDRDYAAQIYQSALAVFSEISSIEVPKDITRYASKATEVLFGYRIV